MATEHYKFGGSKTPGESITTLVLTGSYVNPSDDDVSVELGGTVELSDEQVEELRKSYKLTKVSEETAEKIADSGTVAGDGVGQVTGSGSTAERATGTQGNVHNAGKSGDKKN